MPRITLGDRLQTIVDSPYLPASKLNFAKSLLVFYQRKGMLTRGRRVWVDNFEEMIEARANLEDGDKPDIVQEIDDLIARMPEEDASSWNMGFAQSLREQAMTGHARGYDSPLSEAQRTKLADISAEYTDDALTAREEWPIAYRDTYRNDAVVLADYYASTYYYKDYVRKVRENADYVPPKRFFMKLHTNKYAQKVLKAWEADAKYPAGTMVSCRASAGWPAKQALAKGGIIIASNLPIVSAANGAKRYKVLPVGAAAPVDIEERHIKKFKAPKKA
jgi:hypothetical protein